MTRWEFGIYGDSDDVQDIGPVVVDAEKEGAAKVEARQIYLRRCARRGLPYPHGLELRLLSNYTLPF